MASRGYYDDDVRAPAPAPSTYDDRDRGYYDDRRDRDRGGTRARSYGRDQGYRPRDRDGRATRSASRGRKSRGPAIAATAIGAVATTVLDKYVVEKYQDKNKPRSRPGSRSSSRSSSRSRPVRRVIDVAVGGLAGHEAYKHLRDSSDERKPGRRADRALGLGDRGRNDRPERPRLRARSEDSYYDDRGSRRDDRGGGVAGPLAGAAAGAALGAGAVKVAKRRGSSDERGGSDYDPRGGSDFDRRGGSDYPRRDSRDYGRRGSRDYDRRPSRAYDDEYVGGGRPRRGSNRQGVRRDHPAHPDYKRHLADMAMGAWGVGKQFQASRGSGGHGGGPGGMPMNDEMTKLALKMATGAYGIGKEYLANRQAGGGGGGGGGGGSHF